MKKKIPALLLALLLAGILIARFARKESEPLRYVSNEGAVFGTVYHITYEATTDFKTELEEELQRFDASLSPFNPASLLTRINRNDTTVVADEWFTAVFNRSKAIHALSEGAFDPTVSPLINLWGFGFREGNGTVDAGAVDSLLPLVGLEKIELTPAGKIWKQDERMTLNFSAIAKGFACDVIARFLERRGVTDYLVEIGGEVAAKGVNAKGNCWRIGITRPSDGAGNAPEEIEAVLPLCNRSLATSGNYRNFYVRDGKKYAHTIDPHTGYPVQHALLSATVLAADCMTADAVATACMVLGVEKSLEMAGRTPGIDLLLIYSDETGNLAFATTPGAEALLGSESSR